MSPRFEAERVYVGYGKAPAVVRGVSLALHAGEIVCLMGPNGSGKTTLLRALSGALPMRSGEVKLDGESLAGLPPHSRARKGLGAIRTERSLLPGRTAEENLELAAGARAGLRHLPRPGATVAGALVSFGLEAAAGTLAGALSTGQARRLELARAWLVGYPVLLLDEPFAGLDPLGIQQVSDGLRRIAVEGAAILLVDHRVEHVRALSDRMLLLLGGEVALAATTEEVASSDLTRRAYLGFD